MGDGLQGHGQQYPLELPAGEGADALVEQSLPMDPGQAALHPLPQVGGDGEEHRPATDGGGEEVQDTDGVPPVKAGALGDVTDLGVGGVPPARWNWMVPA